jgi:hypothetical protein
MKIGTGQKHESQGINETTSYHENTITKKQIAQSRYRQGDKSIAKVIGSRV